MCLRPFDKNIAQVMWKLLVNPLYQVGVLKASKDLKNVVRRYSYRYRVRFLTSLSHHFFFCLSFCPTLSAFHPEVM